MKRARYRHVGIALVLVLWVLALLSAMAIALMATQRTETALTRNLISTAQGRALAEAGIYYAIARGLAYRAASDSEKWVADGVPRRWVFAGARVDVAIISEHSFIDLNFAGAELLDRLLQTAGVDEAEISALRDAILDWRDKNTERLLHGAEDDAYETAGRAYGAADVPFNSVSELRQVLGMTSEIYEAIAPALTVYSGQSKINPWFAPTQVLAALPGINENRLADFLELRASHRERGLAPPRPTGVNDSLLDLSRGSVYRIYAEALGLNGERTGLQAIVRAEPEAGPYEILAWNHSPARPPREELEGESIE